MAGACATCVDLEARLTGVASFSELPDVAETEAVGGGPGALQDRGGGPDSPEGDGVAPAEVPEPVPSGAGAGQGGRTEALAVVATTPEERPEARAGNTPAKKRHNQEELSCREFMEQSPRHKICAGETPGLYYTRNLTLFRRQPLLGFNSFIGSPGLLGRPWGEREQTPT